MVPCALKWVHSTDTSCEPPGPGPFESSSLTTSLLSIGLLQALLRSRVCFLEHQSLLRDVNVQDGAERRGCLRFPFSLSSLFSHCVSSCIDSCCFLENYTIKLPFSLQILSFAFSAVF